MRFSFSDQTPCVLTCPESSPLSVETKYCGLKRTKDALISQPSLSFRFTAPVAKILPATPSCFNSLIFIYSGVPATLIFNSPLP